MVMAPEAAPKSSPAPLRSAAKAALMPAASLAAASVAVKAAGVRPGDAARLAAERQEAVSRFCAAHGARLGGLQGRDEGCSCTHRD